MDYDCPFYDPYFCEGYDCCECSLNEDEESED